MGEVSFPGLGARLPSAAVNSVILEAHVIPDYEKPTDQEEAILDFVKGRDVFVFLPTGEGKSLCSATLPSALLPFSSLEKHVRHTYWLLLSVSAIRSPMLHLAKARTKGLLSIRLQKEGFATLQEHTAQRGTSILPVQISHLAVLTSVT